MDRSAINLPELVVEVLSQQRQVEKVKRRFLRRRRSLLRRFLAAETHLSRSEKVVGLSAARARCYNRL